MYTCDVLVVKQMVYTLDMEIHEAGSDLGKTRRSAGDRAYEWISHAILTGEFQEGQFLDEVELSHAVGTSRTPVREALHRLQAERFIDILPRRGAQVRVISARELEEVYATRFVIESHAISEIIERNNGAPAPSTSIAETLYEAGQNRRWNDVARNDQRFHSLIVAQAGNGVLSDLYNSLRPRQIRVSVRTISTAPDRLATIHREHLGILECIRQGDTEKALDTLRQHLQPIPSLMRTFHW